MHLGISMVCLNPEGKPRSEVRQQALNLSKEFDLTSIELILEGIGGLWAPYPWEWEESELREMDDFIAHFKRKGAHLPYINKNLIALNKRVREDAMEQMQLAIEIAKRLKLDYAVVHPSGSTDGWATEREPRRLFLALSRLSGLCNDSGMNLSIENGYNLHDIESWITIIRELKNDGLSVSMTFDTGKANQSLPDQQAPYKKYGAMADAIEGCFDLLDDIHLHNHLSASNQPHLGLSEGEIDLKSCIKRIRDLKYEGSLTLELTPWVKDIKREISTMKEWSED